MMRLKLQLFATNSIVDLLKSQGKDASYSARKELAQSMGITDYSGTAEQNSALVKALSGGGAVAGGGVNGAKTSTGTGAKAGGLNALTGGTVAGAKTQGSSNVGSSAIKGVNQSTLGKIGSSFTASGNVTNAQAEADGYLGKVKEMASAKDIVDQSTWDAINKKWEQPQAVTEAFNYTNQLLEKLSSGKTSYTDQIKDLMGQIQNRDKFSYDVDSDTLFQQALTSAMGSGKTAMQDTMGQASALTGGYGSTYATTAGNQAYNSFIQDAYNNLPEYYQMALEAYQMEGDEMYKQLGMLGDADATEYQRMYESWNANFANAQQMYNKSYGEWQDSVNNAYNSANLQLNEQGQLFDQVYNTYQAVQNDANTKYAQEYQKWSDEVNNAFNMAQMANSDYWNSAEMGYKNRALEQDQKQFDARMTAEASSTKAEQWIH